MADATEQTKTFKQDPRNARRHNDRNVELIATSILDNGFGRSILLANDGTIIAGNATALAAGQAGLDNAMVIESDGSKIIAVRRTDVDPGSDEFYRLSISDNRAAELADWDPAVLTALQEEGVDLSPFWDDEELGALLATLDDAPEPLVDPDTVPEPPKEATTKPGDLYRIGEHFLLCGDSTDPDNVDRVMQGHKANLMATDPPYGVGLRLENAHEASNAAKGVDATYRHFEPIENDDLDGPGLQTLLESVFGLALGVLEKDAAWYVWHAHACQTYVSTACANVGLLLNSQIIWVKPHFVFGRNDYHWQHEPCYYGWIKGNRPPFYGERNQSTTWTTEVGGGSIRKEQNHPTEKPVALFEKPILNHTKPGQRCYEPFAGSGTALIAAEMHGRICHAVEISPIYCDVIIARAAQTFGLVAELVS